VKSHRNCRWWKEPKEEAYTALFALADYIRETQSWQTEADDYHAQMYAGARAACWSTEGVSAYEYEPTHLARNIARSAVDTYVAKVFKHRPLPEILANKGSWRDQRRAKKMTQLVEGEFDKHKVFKRWARAIGRDAGVWGRGVLNIDIELEESKSIRCERVLPEELYVDEADAKHGNPCNLYYITDADVGRVIEAFAEDDEGLARAIEDAGIYDGQTNVRDIQIRTVDRVRLVESWHLCDNEEAHADLEPTEHDCKGRQVVAVRGVSLVDEVWTFKRFPFAVLNYLEPLKGYWGTGLCEQLEGYHHEQNLMSEKVSDGHYYVGGGILYLENAGDVVEEDFTNATGVKILRGAPGGEPKFFNPEPVHPQTYQYLRDIGPDALNEVGMSEMSATGSKEPGLTAAVAINAVDDIQSERLSMQGYGYAEWCCDVAELFLMWIRHIAKKHGDYTARVPLKGGILELNWKDVALDSYVVQVKNSALMRLSPAARRQMAQDMFDRGQLDSLDYMRVVESTDIGAEIDVRTAQRVLADEQIEAMLDAEDPTDPNAYKPPSPYTNDFAWSKARAQQRLAEAISAGCNEANLDLVRDYVLDCEALEAKAAGPSPAPTEPMAPPMMPGPGMPPMPAAA